MIIYLQVHRITDLNRTIKSNVWGTEVNIAETFDFIESALLHNKLEHINVLLELVPPPKSPVVAMAAYHPRSLEFFVKNGYDLYGVYQGKNVLERMVSRHSRDVLQHMEVLFQFGFKMGDDLQRYTQLVPEDWWPRGTYRQSITALLQEKFEQENKSM